MAIIERKEVENVARLARLALAEDEIMTIEEQLGAMLENATISLKSTPTASTPSPTLSLSPTCSEQTKTDRPTPREKVLANAPEDLGRSLLMSRALWMSEWSQLEKRCIDKDAISIGGHEMEIHALTGA